MEVLNISCLGCNKWIKRDFYESPEEAIKKEIECPYKCEKPKIHIYP